jgi:dihydroflavonol-4-reductase
MTRPEAAGQRFLAIAGDVMKAQEVALLIRGHLGEAGRRISTKVMPTWMLKALAPFSRTVRGGLPDIGVARRATSEKARRMLGWAPRSREEAILATVDSLPTGR